MEFVGETITLVEEVCDLWDDFVVVVDELRVEIDELDELLVVIDEKVDVEDVVLVVVILNSELDVVDENVVGSVVRELVEFVVGEAVTVVVTITRVVEFDEMFDGGSVLLEYAVDGVEESKDVEVIGIVCSEIEVVELRVDTSLEITDVLKVETDEIDDELTVMELKLLVAEGRLPVNSCCCGS